MATPDHRQADSHTTNGFAVSPLERSTLSSLLKTHVGTNGQDTAGRDPTETELLSPFTRGALSAAEKKLPPRLQRCMAADYPSPDTMFTQDQLAELAHICNRAQEIHDRGFGNMHWPDDMQTRITWYHQHITEWAAHNILVPKLIEEGFDDIIKEVIPQATPAQRTRLLHELVVQRGKTPPHTITTNLRVAVVIEWWQAIGCRASRARSCPNSHIEVRIQQEWEFPPPSANGAGGLGPATTDSKSKQSAHEDLKTDILRAYGHTTQPVQSGKFVIRAAFRISHPGGDTMSRHLIVCALIGVAAEQTQDIPLENIMTALRNGGAGGKAGEVPKFAAAPKTFIVVLALYTLFTSNVLIGPGTQGSPRRNVWDRVIAHIITAAGSRQKMHSHGYTMKLLQWLCLCGATVSINIGAFAAFSEPFIEDITKTITAHIAASTPPGP